MSYGVEQVKRRGHTKIVFAKLQADHQTRVKEAGAHIKSQKLRQCTGSDWHRRCLSIQVKMYIHVNMLQ